MPLEEKATKIERHLLREHLSPEGVLLYFKRCGVTDPTQDGYYQLLTDTPIWTGALAAGLACHYRLTGDPRYRKLLIRVLRGLELLHDVTGKPGLLARAIFPRAIENPYDEGEWHDAPPPHDLYRYLGDVSKDQYFGPLMGYAATLVELGIDDIQGDAEIRDLIEHPACAIADHIWENDLNIVDIDGEVTEHGDLAGYFLFIPLGPNAALSLGSQLVAYRVSGEPRFRERYEKLLDEGYADATRLVKFEYFGKTNHSNDNMGMMGFYALTHLEQDPEILEIYEKNMTKLWNYTRNEGNAFWHVIYASRKDLPRFARFDVRENLRLFPVDRVQTPADARGYAAVEKDCFNNRQGVEKNTTALPVHVRRRSGFVWKECPFALWGFGNPETCVAGADYLVAYWMAQCYLGDPEVVPEEDAGDERAQER